MSTKTKKIDQSEQFCIDTINGLNANPKYLSSKYFYDQTGDQIFQQIMDADEYYLTNSEMEIFATQTEELAKTIALNGYPFDLIELGAGDATKSIHLLKQLISDEMDFHYLPIDISENVINLLSETLPAQLPELKMKGLNGEYFEMLKEAASFSNRRKVVLFMGANIGNMTPEEAAHFCEDLRNQLMDGDMLIIGFDLKKNPLQILSAYSDSKGVTKSFNLNLLRRINREIGADFNTDKFDHYASYDPISGACKSFLISLQDQQVMINGESISFNKNEPIYMEISQKYNLDEIDAMMTGCGFKPVKNFLDAKEYFVDSIWQVG
ncbi:L-histidine N(alpha)-methyltransferase [Pedobacter mucosus]|uniref:L-histidine N(alpha)-methyltransferase n=1 Tax=Pedobacter mucosus TaxID=2895286 RepID=UPI001EE469D9|nr:L-histidine N(alpha)-methyltransferase [Pedobacter mucosus]UKT65266.1 L-histidine N(alpha)-methyltransferase [Pedobacter mucosus]